MSASFEAKYIKFSTATGGSGYTTEYQAVYDAMTNKPTSGIASAQNTMVQSLKTAGLWSKIDVLYIFAQYSNGASEALINWKNPGTYNADINNSPTFTSLRGFTGNGSNSYIGTNWNPSTNGVNYTQNSASAFYYARSMQTNTASNFGAESGSNAMVDVSNGSSSIHYQSFNNAPYTSNSATFGSNGFFIYNRASSSSFEIYKNNGVIGGDSLTSTAVVNREVYVLALNDGSVANPSGAEIAVFGCGSSLSSQERTNLQSAIETYMDSNGFGIIS